MSMVEKRMNPMVSLFMSQSYQDAWDDYIRSLNRESFLRWDFVILTASNEQQAQGFRAQIRERIDAGFLPLSTHFAVIPDPDGKRVGSGGATLNVLRYIADVCGSTDFSGRRILVIHSGGDSKRVPQYSALGKLFSPVPRELPNGRASTLFDELMVGMSGVPGRIREGMMLLSGDVLLLFNALQIEFSGSGAAAISFRENVETGKNHGVYLMGQDGNAARFLHKQSVEKLRAAGAVDDSGFVDIDTGAVIFSADILKSLYGLVCENGKFSPSRFEAYVNETVRLSLYGDFLYPMAAQSTLESFFLEQPEGAFCEELTSARTELWNVLRPYRMKLLRLSPAKFIHFGTTREIMQLMCGEIDQYRHLAWSDQVNSSVHTSDAAAYGSILSPKAKYGENVYLEVSCVHSGAKIGRNVILSHIEIYDEVIPDGVVLHGLKQRDGCFVVRIYGIGDNPKGSLEEGGTLMEVSLTEFMEKHGLAPTDLWDCEEHSLWNARLYPTCGSMREAVHAALNLYALVHGEGDLMAWKTVDRKSLCAGFRDADPDAVIAWNQRMQRLVRMEQLAKLISDQKPVYEAKGILQAECLTKDQTQWFENRLKNADFSERIRLYYYIGKALGGTEGERYIDKCFDAIRHGMIEGAVDLLRSRRNFQIVKDKSVVEMPLRVNWGGGWSDTPPYCNENGGTVLNAAILLNGEKPVRVGLRRLDEMKIVMESADLGAVEEFCEIGRLRDCSDPSDPFALPKAALIACGIIPDSSESLEEVLKRMGGGFSMSTEVRNVPKGSGLGTSSILAGACVKALHEFFGISCWDDDLYDYVLCMEQMMSTGGGWQDQVGGMTGGIKFITSKPGIRQRLQIEYLRIDDETRVELNGRYVLIYTGQRRLARNLLRDVVGRYLGNEPETVRALTEVQRIADLMRLALEKGSVDEFAKLMTCHWELSRRIDSGSTNACIEHIFRAAEDLLDGKMICGAGGGGFLQGILKKGVTPEMLQERLNGVFHDSSVAVWQCQLV